MSHIVNIHQAKTNFSKLIDSLTSEHEIIIARAGKPVAKLVTIQPQPRKRGSGLLKGKIKIAPDFDDSLPDDILNGFEGN